MKRREIRSLRGFGRCRETWAKVDRNGLWTLNHADPGKTGLVCGRKELVSGSSLEEILFGIRSATADPENPLLRMEEGEIRDLAAAAKLEAELRMPSHLRKEHHYN